MADTFTTNYNWTKPAVGGDPDTWGGLLNTDLDGIDSTVFAVSGVANAAMPKSGGAFTGGVTGTAITLTGLMGAVGFTVPTGATQGIQIVWNQIASGQGHVEYVNNYGAGNGSHYWYQRSSTAGGAVQQMQLDPSGNLTTVGSVTSSQNFSSSTTNVVLAPSASGSVYMRPAGNATTTGQFILTTTLATFSTNLEVGSGALHVIGGTTAFNGQGSYIGWNRTAGQGEMDFISHKGGGAGGFWFYNTDGTTYTQLSNLNSSGVWSATDFTATSDSRLKDEIKPLKRGIATLKRMIPREYVKYLNMEFVGEGKPEVGFLAQEVEQVLPEAVSMGADGFRKVSHGQITAVLARAVLEIAHALELEGIL